MRAGLRVVLVAPGFPTSLADHHKPFLADHARALAAAGAEVTVVCPAHPDAPRRHQFGGEVGGGVGAVSVRRVRFGPRRVEARVAHGESYRVFSGLSALWVVPMIVRLAWAAAREVRRGGGSSGDVCRVVHGHWWFPCGLVAVLAAGRRAASVVQVHGSDAAVTSNAVHRWLARRVLRRAGAVVAVSEGLRGWAAGLIERKTVLQVVAMPVGTDRLGSAGSNMPAPADGPVVAVGRLMHEKGFDVLIEALGLLDSRDRPELVLLGDGPDRSRLEALALRRGVKAIFTGALAPSEVAAWYRRARLVCVPSRREGFGMVVAEALAAGRPVVAASVGGAPVLLADSELGELVEPGDPQALTDAIRRVLSDAPSEANEAALGLRADLPNPELHELGPQAHAAALLAIYEAIN